MNTQVNSSNSLNSYLYHFQEAQTNLVALIKEERIQKRIRKSRKRLAGQND